MIPPTTQPQISIQKGDDYHWFLYYTPDHTILMPFRKPGMGPKEWFKMTNDCKKHSQSIAIATGVRLTD